VLPEWVAPDSSSVPVNWPVSGRLVLFDGFVAVELQIPCFSAND